MVIVCGDVALRCLQPHGGARRPVWFVYSGMGSQWVGMGRDLMRVPIFRAAIERCHEVLRPHGVDLMHIVTTKDDTIFDNILHSFVGIAAVQVRARAFLPTPPPSVIVIKFLRHYFRT